MKNFLLAITNNFSEKKEVVFTNVSQLGVSERAPRTDGLRLQVSQVAQFTG